MKTKTGKRLLSMIMACVMIIGMLPTVAFADGNVATVGGTSYQTLQAAITAATSGQTVQLIADTTEDITVENDDNIILDLNGFKLSGSSNDDGHNAITSSGQLTIRDSQGNGQIVAKTDRQAVRATGGTVTIESGTFSGGKYAVVSTGSGTTVNIQGGSFNGSSAAVQAQIGGTVNIYDGTFTSENGNGIVCLNTSADSGTTVNLSGGQVTAPTGVVVQSGANYSNTTECPAIVTISGSANINGSNESAGMVGVLVFGLGAELNVEGGTIKGNTFAISGNGLWDGTTINISGGTIYSTAANAIYHPQEGDLTISGGTITGTSGVQYCGTGTVTISGNAVITATANVLESPTKPDEQNDGSIEDGAALSIVSRGGGYQAAGKTATVNITGGTLISNNNSPIQIYRYQKVDDSWKANEETSVTNALGSLDITEGTFIAPENKQVLSVDSTAKEKVEIAGGSYSAAVDSDFLASSIKAQLYSSTNGTTPYSYHSSLSDAIAAAQPGDEITRLNVTTGTNTYNVTLTYYSGAENVTFPIADSESFTLPNAYRSDYTLTGWTDGTDTYKVGATVTITDDTTFTAIWRSNYVPPVSYNYPVTLPTDLENGSVTVAKEDLWATAGEKITITVTPDAGYMLDELTITDKAGNKVDFTDNGDGTITFTMPAAGVSIDAAFVVDPDYEAPTDEPEEPDTPTLVEERYTDVAADAWYRDAVQYVVDNGIMTGTSATTFEPQTATTRAMIVSMLHRLENAPAAEAASFTDVAAGSWYADPVAWAAANGIVGGYEDDTFQPNKSISREELASILYRYAQYKGYDVSARADLSIYTDAPSAWAADVMAWANAEGLITGRTATTIDAQATLTRAETAAIFQRFLTE